MQAWQLATPVAEPYREFAERWGNADFSKYVDILEQNADEAIQDADEVDHTYNNLNHSCILGCGPCQPHWNTLSTSTMC